MKNGISFPGLGLSFEVSRSLFSVFGVPVYTYGLLIALGVCLAFLYAVREVKRSNITQDDFLNMFIIGLPVAIVCARLYYCIFSWDSYKDDLWQILNLRGGGLAIYGGVIGAALSVLIYCRVKKLSVGSVLDILAVGLLIGQTVGRWGNFVNGEAFGAECNLPWTMTIVRGTRTIAESVHPTFLYESLWNAAGVGVLLLLKRKKVFEGELACCYMVWYGLGRFMIEGLRADSLMLGPLRVSQVLSALLVVAGLILIIKNYKKHLTRSE
ncbi:MAG: prolipoprotein diacylglyceryl transferase [Ruminococcaceae bacterium]|nr:prolipoprotein diacylglyceryl transferase [Oscillospiraceae bacterium]